MIKAWLWNPLVYTQGNEKSSTTFLTASVTNFTGKEVAVQVRAAAAASNGSYSFYSEMLRFTQN